MKDKKISKPALIFIVLITGLIAFGITWVGVAHINHRNTTDVSPIAYLDVEKIAMLENALWEFGELSELYRQENSRFPEEDREIDVSGLIRTSIPEGIVSVHWRDVSDVTNGTISVTGHIEFICPISPWLDENHTRAHIRYLWYRVYPDSSKAIDMVGQNIDELREHFFVSHRWTMNQRFREGFISYSNDNDTSILLSPIIYSPRTNVLFYAELYVRIGNVVFWREVHIPANSRWDFQAVAESREMQSYIIRMIYDLVDGL